ncbi:MAG: DNA phosphorothioation-associated putative methyltransferase [Oscillatoria princeps RMCB-10]|nr:DNA phosphorothioation-associated putative methyltransferase [Oscillatoria princeps RMCB-10]
MADDSIPLPPESPPPSRPVLLAQEAGILNQDTTFLDCSGDGNTPRTPADIVNLSYTLNLIKSPDERRNTLRQAWALARQVLIVAEKVLIDDRESGKVVFGDGTFTPCTAGEKYFQHRQLKTYTDRVLQTDAVPTGLGVYFVFRDSSQAETFRISRFRSPIPIPAARTGIQQFEENRQLLTPLMAFFSERGRLPIAGELPQEPELIAKFGTLQDAFQLISQATGSQQWDAITDKRRQDILVYLACTRRPIETLPSQIQNDISALFDSRQQAGETVGEMLLSLSDTNIITACCQNSPTGKKLPGALYVHISALPALNPLLRIYEGFASATTGRIDGATLVKFSTDKPKISYLFYPDFDTNPHPALLASIQIDLPDLRIAYRDYSASDNPPVLHRKDAFVTPDYPQYETFAQLTRQEEALGLLDPARAIGTRQVWLRCLQDDGLEIEGHRVVRRLEGVPVEAGDAPDGSTNSLVPKIERHKAAIVRSELSRPVRLALEAGLFSENTTFFDYGCGYGGDVQRIAQQGHCAAGWDPYYFPNNSRTPADIVNIGYVINVIEIPEERREALIKAWELTGRVLLVAAQVLIDDGNSGQIAYGDGVITRRNTFQKYYEQEELKIYIDRIIGTDAIPAALGIYFVFRDSAEAEIFRMSRFRSRAITPRVRIPSKRFEDYQELLQPLMAFVTERGRLPVKGELAGEAELLAEFGYFRRAFQTILQVTDPQEWEAIAARRRQDTLVYLALKQISLGEDRSLAYPKYHAPEIQNDIKGLFGTYQEACDTASALLHSTGILSIIAKLCQTSTIGQQLPNALCVHVCALQELHAILRIYEGVVCSTIGRMDEATLVKFHTDALKISYLFYPDFDTDAHPALHTSMQIDLKHRRVTYRDYDTSDEPPVLHRKDACVTPDYPLYKTFAQLTRQEENWGLLDDLSAIRTRKGWLKCLQEHCAEIRNHKVYWRKDADPYRVKYLRSAREARRKNREAGEIN